MRFKTDENLPRCCGLSGAVRLPTIRHVPRSRGFNACRLHFAGRVWRIISRTLGDLRYLPNSSHVSDAFFSRTGFFPTSPPTTELLTADLATHDGWSALGVHLLSTSLRVVSPVNQEVGRFREPASQPGSILVHSRNQRDCALPSSIRERERLPRSALRIQQETQSSISRRRSFRCWRVQSRYSSNSLASSAQPPNDRLIPSGTRA